MSKFNKDMTIGEVLRIDMNAASVHFSFVLPLFFPVPGVVAYLLLEFVSAYYFPSIYAGLRVFKFPFCTPFGTCLFCLFELK